MELPELNALKSHLEGVLRDCFPDHNRRVSVDYPDGPNPLCFFELDGRCFAQGSFWANNEYRVEAMDTQNSTEIMNEAGMATSLEAAIAVIIRFCELAKASAARSIKYF